MIRKDGVGQVDLVDARMLQGKIWVGVRPVENPAAELVWLDASMLQEIGADEDDHR